jgi:hypothetical protein
MCTPDAHSSSIASRVVGLWIVVAAYLIDETRRDGYGRPMHARHVHADFCSR